MFYVAAQPGEAEALCGFVRLHNSMVSFARVFNLLTALQKVKNGPWTTLTVEKNIDALKPVCLGIIKFHSRLGKFKSLCKA